MLNQKEVSDIMKKEIPELLHARIKELEDCLELNISVLNKSKRSWNKKYHNTVIDKALADSEHVLNKGVSV